MFAAVDGGLKSEFIISPIFATATDWFLMPFFGLFAKSLNSWLHLL
jgi:hypothetical protein